MAIIKGKKEYLKWKKGNHLTRKEAMLAYCYQCNGFDESKMDCESSDSCPLYEYYHYKDRKGRVE